MVARCDAAFFGLLCPLEVGVFSVVFTPTFLAGRVWRRVWGRCRSKVGEEIAINTPIFRRHEEEFLLMFGCFIHEKK